MSKTTNQLIQEWQKQGLPFDEACTLINKLIEDRQDKKVSWKEFIVTTAKASAFCVGIGWMLAVGQDLAFRTFGTKDLTVNKHLIEVVYKLDNKGEVVELSREEVDPDNLELKEIDAAQEKAADIFSDDFVWPEDEPDETVYR